MTLEICAGLCFCDFGGGIEPYDRGRPHHAACRELAEELLSLGTPIFVCVVKCNSGDSCVFVVERQARDWQQAFG